MGAAHVALIYTIKDAKGAKSTFTVNFPDSVNIDVLKTFAGSTAALVDDLIKGQIVDIGIGMTVALPGGLKASPVATADVEEKARFQFTAASGAITGFSLPTYDETFTIAGSGNVDTANATVDTFVDRILEGQTVLAVNVSPSDDRGSDITGLSSARESYASSRG